MKARGVDAAIANAICNATGVRVRDYPMTLDKLLKGLPLDGVCPASGLLPVGQERVPGRGRLRG